MYTFESYARLTGVARFVSALRVLVRSPRSVLRVLFRWRTCSYVCCIVLPGRDRCCDLVETLLQCIILTLEMPGSPSPPDEHMVAQNTSASYTAMGACACQTQHHWLEHVVCCRIRLQSCSSTCTSQLAGSNPDIRLPPTSETPPHPSNPLH